MPLLPPGEDQDEPVTRNSGIQSQVERLPRALMLFEEFQSGPPRHDRGSYTKEALRWILWRRAAGDSYGVLAKDLGLLSNSKVSIWTVVQGVKNSPDKFMDSNFIWPVDLSGVIRKHREYFCRYCGMLYKSPADAIRHAYEHVFDDSPPVGGSEMPPNANLRSLDMPQ